jgi:molecular chaperone Hsp33
MFQDYLFFGADIETRYAFRMLNLSTLVEYARQAHKLSPQKTSLLGKTMLANLLLSSLLDEEERINIRVQAENHFTLASECTKYFEIRGYLAAENTEFCKALDTSLNGSPIANYSVRSVRAKNGVGNVFEGITEHHACQIETALSEHFEQSFQMKTSYKFYCEENADGKIEAFGVVYLELPNLNENIKNELAAHIAQIDLKKLYQTSHDPDFLAHSLIPHTVRPINSKKPTWNCTCSQVSIEAMLVSLPQHDRLEMLSKKEDLTINCHYCNKNFTVSVHRQNELFVGAGNSIS